MYNCELCFYSTTDRSNFYHHKQTKKHILNMESQLDKKKDNSYPKLSQEKDNFSTTKQQHSNICINCKKIFTHKSNLSRHKKICKKNNSNDGSQNNSNNENQEILSLKLEQEKRINQILSDMLTNANIIVNKTTNLANNAQNVTMSALNYANKIYKDAPYIKPIENFKIKNLDYDNNNEKSQLIETILYHARTNSLDKLLGDHIVKHYKTDDPAEQMFHSTDVARLSYIVKQLIEEASEKNNYIGEDEWQKDPSGKEICKHIIDPLNKKIIEILGEYQKKLFEKNPLNLSKDEKETMKIICEIIIDEEIGTLSTNINKYIAPFFNLKKKEIIKDSDKKT